MSALPAGYNRIKYETEMLRHVIDIVKFVSSLIEVLRENPNNEVMFTRDIALDETFQNTFNNLSHPDTMALVAQAQQAVSVEINANTF